MAGQYIVGICGGSGSGKTSFIRDLADSFTPGLVSIISQDNYYFPIERQSVDQNGQVNFDLPTAIDRENLQQDLETLANGGSIFRTEYTFNNDAREPKLVEVCSASVVIIEGLFILHFEEIRRRMDLKVFMDVPEALMLQRRLARDVKERGYSEESVRYQWEHHVMPAFNQHLKPYRSDCHLIVENTRHYKEGLHTVREHIERNILHQVESPVQV